MPAPVIDECLFPEKISRGARGGFQFSTIVVASATGVEQRLAQWNVARARWDVSHALLNPADAQTLIAFFAARRGKARGFRFLDWADYQATNEVLTPTGAKTLQLTKKYTSCSITYTRNIYKPISSPAVTCRRATVSFTNFTVDTTTGLITFTVADQSRLISGITQASSAVITTTTSHTFAVNDVVFIEGVNGMTQINNLTGIVTATTSNTLTVNINSSAFSAYVSGGTVAKYVQPGEVFDWSGQFHVPVRFDTDQLNLEQIDVTIRGWEGIPILELR